MDYSALKEIGLNDPEITIYVSLVKTGPRAATDIAKDTGLYRPYVYDNLEKLIKKGLVTSSKVNSRSIYEASDPKRLIDILDSRKESIKEIIDNLSRRKQSRSRIEILEGKDGLRIFYERLYNDMKQSHIKTLYVSGGTGEAAEHLRYYFPKLLEKGILEDMHKNTDIRMIYNSRAKDSPISSYSSSIGLKFTEEQYDTESTTIITDNLTAQMSLKGEPAIYMNYNPEIISSEKKRFRLMWDNIQ